MQQGELFSAGAAMPEGFVYRADFVSAAEETELVSAIEGLAFDEIRMRGVVAKRRTVQFGKHYGFETFKLTQAAPIPAFLLPLRDRVGDFASCDPVHFEEALVTEYSPGAQIGWHRDAPPFDIVVGVSLLSDCVMQFRRWPVAKATTSDRAKRSKPLSQTLAARSVYVLRGAVRTAWQHHIPAAKTLRYSVTFRTLRARGD
jgi:alkylated DNA repair dioxygenase AlkB